MSNIYYVYVYLDPRKPGIYKYLDNIVFEYEPFYIGKGQGLRYRSHLSKSVLNSGENPHKANKIKKIKSEGFNMKQYIVIIKKNMLEQEALDYESSLIQSIGRECTKTGPLTNIDLTCYTQGKITLEEKIGEERAKIVKHKRSLAASGKNNPMYGISPTSRNTKRKQESIDKTAKTRKIPIIQIDKETRLVLNQYDSIAEAGRKLGINVGNLADCLRGKHHTCGGYAWAYLNYRETKKNRSYYKNKNVEICQIDIKTNKLIKVYQNFKHAAKELNVNYNSIRECVNKRRLTAYGFIWITLSEYQENNQS